MIEDLKWQIEDEGKQAVLNREADRTKAQVRRSNYGIIR